MEGASPECLRCLKWLNDSAQSNDALGKIHAKIAEEITKLLEENKKLKEQIKKLEGDCEAWSKHHWKNGRPPDDTD
jgi:cell division protein FtsB